MNQENPLSELQTTDAPAGSETEFDTSPKSDHPTDTKVWAGFDLGGTKMLAKIYNEEYKTLGKKRRKTKSHKGEESALTRIIETLHEALEEAELSKENLAGIGIGCPGILDLKKGVVELAPNLGWKNTPLQKELEKEFGCSAVIGNDVDLGVYGEAFAGAGRGARSVLGIFPGTGIGGGFIYDQKILVGSKSSCMEIGHIQVVPNGQLCGCGRRGCLETIASRLAISSQAAQAAYRGQAPYLRELVGTHVEEIKSGALAQSIAHGDKAVERIVTTAAEYIGVAIGNMVNLLAPDIVVLGGGLVEAMPELFVKNAFKLSQRVVLPMSQGSYEVVAAELGDDSTVLGAAAWAREIINK